MNKFKPSKNNALIYVVALLSCINFLNLINGLATPGSIGISVIGLIGVLLFFAGKGIFKYFILLWIFAQAIIIIETTKYAGTNVTYTNKIFDLSQVFHIKAGFYLGSNNSTIGINFNLLVVLYLFLYRIIKTDAWIGKSVDLFFLKNNLDLVAEEGTYLTFTQRINLDKDDNWLLGELSSAVFFNQQKIDRLAVYTEKGLLTNIFRAIPHDKLLWEKKYSASDFERVEWVVLA